MEIRFFSNLRTLVGLSFLEVSNPDIDTLDRLFDWLTGKYPEIKFHLLNDQGNLRPDVPVFVNGRNPRLFESGITRKLNREDVISLFSPISSGTMNVEVMREPTYGKQE
jgi:MoaD family protein